MSPRPPAAMRDTGVESYRLLRRAGLRTVGALLGLPYGVLLLAALVVGRWRPGFAATVQQWELRRLERFYLIRVISEGEAPAEADRGGPGGDGHDVPAEAVGAPTSGGVRGRLTGLGPSRDAAHGVPTPASVPAPPLLHLAGQALIGLTTGYFALHLALLVVLMAVGVLVQLLVAGPLSSVTLDFVTWAVSQPLFLTGWVYVLAAASALWAAAEGTAWLTERWHRRTSAVERTGSVEDRIGQLITTRRGVVRAIDDERRRIERDLHDGVQQHTISLSMLLARARRSQDPERVAELLERAHTQSQELIEEMRQVAWRIHPAALDDLGLNQALTVVAQNSPLPVELSDSLTSRPAPEVESATYFVAREAVTNTVKHAGATAVRLTLETVTTSGTPLVRLVVSDDGRGGADPQGSGLQGLRRRVEALDGEFSVSSPTGGPTVVTAEIPYE